jgi:peptide/nickel transport system permease protein
MTTFFQRAFSRIHQSDLWFSFTRSKVTLWAAAVFAVLVIAAFGAEVMAPHNPMNLATLELSEARLPPAWQEGGTSKYLLGTDDQGRDLLSALMYGTRISILVGLAAVGFALVLGVTLGLIAGYAGGVVDAAIMRVCDVMLSFPSILVALLVDGILHAVIPRDASNTGQAFFVVVLAIGLTLWVKYARTVRSSVMVEKNKEYVQAARVMGASTFTILFKHIFPNVLSPITVLATLHIAQAIITEATLSYLGVGVPPTSPSLGTLIRIGNEYLFSGEWWITVWPGLTLVVLVLSANLLGDWLRDALNPRLQ